jgi:hypothetical protein
MNQLFGNCYLAGEAGLATQCKDGLSLRMRKMNYSYESAVGNCYLASEAGLAAQWKDSLSLRMRKMNYSRESAVCKLLPG